MPYHQTRVDKWYPLLVGTHIVSGDQNDAVVEHLSMKIQQSSESLKFDPPRNRGYDKGTM